MMGQRLVVIGAGMASGRVLEHLVEAAPDAFDITLFNAEPRGNYNRIMLSPVLSGEKTYAEIVTHDADWYARHGIATRFGEHVTRIDRARRVVATAKGETPYDHLLIATGSAPFIIPVPGRELKGVVTYRDLDDTEAMIAAARPGAKAVVIGGGLLGLEAAAGLALRGIDVTVIHLMGHLMERQLDPAAGYLLQKALEARCIRIHCKGATKAILGHDRVEAVLLEDGTTYGADLVVMAVGIRPETRLATDAGLDVGRGITVSDAMVTSDPAILAVGECVEHERQLFGLVAPLYDQAKVAAATLLGQEAAASLMRLAAGMDDHVAKPFVLHELIEILLAHTRPARQSQPAPVMPLPEADGPVDRALAAAALGSQELYDTLVPLFLDDGPRTLQALHQACADGNRMEAHRLAHTLKGTAGTMGARALARAAMEVETCMAQPFSSDDAPALVGLELLNKAMEAALTNVMEARQSPKEAMDAAAKRILAK